MIEYLTGDDIRAFHEVALERYIGAAGEHEPGQIDFMANKPASEFGGTELYPGVFLKAAIYMHGFATRQFFVDGNKRTAYFAAAAFLELNGYTLTITDDQLYDMTIDVANKLVDEHQLAQWLKSHSI